jgi:hypothetical protein
LKSLELVVYSISTPYQYTVTLHTTSGECCDLLCKSPREGIDLEDFGETSSIVNTCYKKIALYHLCKWLDLYAESTFEFIECIECIEFIECNTSPNATNIQLRKKEKSRMSLFNSMREASISTLSDDGGNRSPRLTSPRFLEKKSRRMSLSLRELREKSSRSSPVSDDGSNRSRVTSPRFLEKSHIFQRRNSIK